MSGFLPPKLKTVSKYRFLAIREKHCACGNTGQNPTREYALMERGLGGFNNGGRI